MWHEARRQERKIRGMLVDYRRRAERRRDFYEKIKADPTQFMQVHGRQCKIHLDPNVAAAADSPAAMMPWQGQTDNLIDRFDVRAHLDYIPPVKKQEEVEELTYEERQINYERYRVIAQNSFLGIQEEKFLKQLQLEEQFGYTEPESKKKKSGGATIGFNYEDGTTPSQSLPNQEESDDDNSDSDLDVDLYINVSKIDQQQAHEMNKHGLGYGMSSNDFYSFLTNDMEEAESNRLAREEEHEKALFSGRKSRRERRAHRERRLANRVISPPSYAARTSPTYPTFRESKSPSHSPSPENTGKITYITSFGGDDDPPTTSKPTYADKVKYGRKSKVTRHISPDYKNASTDRKRRRSSSSERSSRFRRKRSRSLESRSSKTRRQSRSRDRYKRRRSRSIDRKRRYRPRRSHSFTSPSDRSKSRSMSISKGRLHSESKKLSSRSRSKSKSLSSNSSESASSKTSSSSVTESRDRGVSVKKESPPKVLPRYYGRKRSDQSSSSELDDGSDADTSENKNAPNSLSNDNRPGYGNAGSSFKKTSTVPVMSLQERLRRKRQAQLNKQFKADKLAEQIKSEREKQEQQNREDELREMAIRLRRRQREIRHAYDSHNSSNSSSDSDVKKSPSSNRSNQQRSRSSSPKERKRARSYERKDGGENRSSRRGSPRRRPRETSGSDQEQRRKREDYRRERDYKRNDREHKKEEYRRSEYKKEGSRRTEHHRDEDSRRESKSSEVKDLKGRKSLVDY